MNVRFVGVTRRGLVSFTAEHSHPNWELVCYLKGSGTLHINGRDYPFSPGTVICQPPHIPHSEDSADGYRNIFIEVSDFAPARSTDVLIYRETHPFLRTLFHQIYAEFHLKRNNNQAIVSSLMETITQYLAGMSPGRNINPYVAELESKIIENITNCNFALEKEIRRIPLSDEYFRKLFQKQIGVTPLQYLTQKRISYAKKLLESSTYSMKVFEVSAQSGFADVYYFSRVFKKLTGLSPLQYHRQKKTV